MRTNRIDQLIQYALVVAGGEDYGQRQLGPIHLIKYVYLGDLAYAEAHGGDTYTGAPWRFYHYGPWAEEVFERIEPVIGTVGAKKRTYVSTRFENDAVRFELVDEERRQALERELPLEVQLAIRRAVHDFGAATSDLLHSVYRTKPMLCAAPNEPLRFDLTVEERVPIPPKAGNAKAESQLSKTAQRKREGRLQAARERLQEKLHERRKQKRRIPAPIVPRYDEMFFEGLQMIDDQDRTPIESSEGQLEVADDIWKSPARTESDLP